MLSHRALPVLTRLNFSPDEVAACLIERPLGDELEGDERMQYVSTSLATGLMSTAFEAGVYSLDGLRAINADADAPGVIKLERNNIVLVPAFQFDSRGQLRPIVAQINETLEVGISPIGAASWWLSENVFLRDQPALQSRGLPPRPASLLELDSSEILTWPGGYDKPDKTLNPEATLTSLANRVGADDGF